MDEQLNRQPKTFSKLSYALAAIAFILFALLSILFLNLYQQKKRIDQIESLPTTGDVQYIHHGETDSVISAMILEGTISEADIADSAVVTIKLADGSITTAKIEDGSITSAKIADGTVLAIDISDSAIVTAKVEDGAITGVKFADGSVSLAKLSASMCSTGQILKKINSTTWGCSSSSDASGGSAGVASIEAGDGLSNSGTASDPILNINTDGTTIKIVGDSLQLADGAVTAVKLANNSVTTAKIIDGAITTGKLANGAITEIKLADGSVATAKLVNGAITTAKIGDIQVTGAKIADLAVSTGKLADSAITTVKIQDATILFTDLAQNACSDGQIMKWDDGISAWTCSDDNDTPLSEAQIEAYIFDADNTGTLSSGTLALDLLSYTGDLGAGELVSTVMIEGENVSLLNNDSGYITSYSETDPIFVASDVYDITNTDQSNWNTAYGWGDHSTQNYLDLDTNPNTDTDSTDDLVNSDFGSSGLMAADGAGAYSIVTNNSSNWNTAYGWGDWSGQGFITASSTDILTNKSGNISMWTNNSGYLTSFTETDPTLTNDAAVIVGSGGGDLVMTFDSDAGIDGTLTYMGASDTFSFNGALSAIGYNSSNWNTAFGWGDWSGQGFITASSTDILTNKSGNISMWTNNSGYLTSFTELDPVWTGAASNYFNLGENETVSGIPAFDGGENGISAPFTVDSNYLVTNLNADFLDGHDFSYFQTAGSYDNYQYWTATDGAVNTNIASTGTLTFAQSGIAAVSLAGNTLTISATEADMLADVTGRGAVTTNQLAFNFNSGSPFTVLNSTVVASLNADLLDGLDSTAFMGAGADNWVDEIGDTMTGNLTLSGGSDLILSSAGDLLLGTTYLNEITSATDTGAYLVGSFDEFDNSNSINVQDVLDDLDATISAIAGGGLVADSLNFTEFMDSMSLDANTGVGFGVFNYTFDLDSTGDFLIQDNGVTHWEFRDDGNLYAGADAMLNMGTNKIEGLGDPDSGDDALSMDYGDGRYINDGSGEIDAPADFNFTVATFITNLDADFLDGLDSSAFMVSGADDWVDESGDTMTGNLILNGANILTATAHTGDIGSTTAYLNALYVDELYTSGSSIYMNGSKILESGASTLNFTADTDQNLQTQTSGSGNLQFTTSGTGNLQLTTTSTGDIVLGSSDQIQLTSAGATTIQSTGLNANIVINAAGTNSQLQLAAIDEIDLTTPIIDINGNLSVSGNITDATWTANEVQDIYISDGLTISALGTVADGSLSSNVSLLGQTIGIGEVENGITLDTEWDNWDEHPSLTDAYILVGNSANQAVAVSITGDVSISNTGVTAVTDDSHTHTSATLPASTSYLGATISKDELDNAGVLIFDWGTDEIASSVIIESEAISLLTNDAGFITDDTSVAKNHLINSGVLSFDWTDGEIDDALTIDATGAVDAGAIKSGNLNIARMPAGGDWSLSSNLNIDGNLLYLDHTNARVGIGAVVPSVKLDVEGQARFDSTVYPVVDIYRNTGSVGNGIYGGARLNRETINPTNGGGLGFFFFYPDSGGVLEEAGMFGGALADITNGAEIGEIIFGAAYAGTDPYSRRDLTIRAVSASTSEVRVPYRLKVGADSSPSKALDVAGDAIISGNVGIGTTDPGAKLDVAGTQFAQNPTSGNYWINYVLGTNADPNPGDIILLIPNPTGTVSGSFLEGDVTATRGTTGSFRSHKQWHINASRAYIGAATGSIAPLSSETSMIKLVTCDYDGQNYIAIDTSAIGASSQHWKFTGSWLNTTNSQKPTLINRVLCTTIIDFKTHHSLGGQIHINSSTDVGIGTSSPDEKLDINGRIYIADSTAPGTTTNRLYSVSGDLYWDGTKLNAVSLPNSFVQYDSVNRSFGTGWADGKTWDTVTIRNQFDVDLEYSIPARNDYTSWGGGYVEIQYSLNGGAWTSLGNSGYQLAMGTSAGIIATHSQMLRITRAELGGVTGDFNIQFKFRHRSYQSTLYVNQSSGASGEKFFTTVRITEATSDSQNFAGMDLAENFPTTETPSPKPGELVSADPENPEHVLKSVVAYDSGLLGAVSTRPGMILGAGQCNDPEGCDEKMVSVALAGRIPISISTINGKIKTGDPITSSQIPGIGMKATESGVIVGKALEGFDPDDEASASKIEQCPNGTPEGITCGRIIVFVNSYWNGTDRTENDLLDILGQENDAGNKDNQEIWNKFTLAVQGSLNKLGVFIKDGMVKAKELVVDMVRTNDIEIKGKIQLQDQLTGEIYCTWIENGEWVKVKSSCENIDEFVSEPEPETESGTEQESDSETGTHPDKLDGPDFDPVDYLWQLFTI